MRVFVYGTLRWGQPQPLAQRLAMSSDYLGPGWLPGRLYRIDWYPGAIHLPEASTRVWGDVFALPALEAEAWLRELDTYEGCGPDDALPHEYRRESLPVQTAKGETLTAWVYLYQWPLADAQWMASGDFLAPEA